LNEKKVIRGEPVTTQPTLLEFLSEECTPWPLDNEDSHDRVININAWEVASVLQKINKVKDNSAYLSDPRRWNHLAV